MKPIIYLHGILEQFKHETTVLFRWVCWFLGFGVFWFWCFVVFFFNLTVFCLRVHKERLLAWKPFCWACLVSVQCIGRESSSLWKVAHGLLFLFLFLENQLFPENHLFPPADALDSSTESTHGGTNHILGSYWQLGYAPGTFKIEINSKSLL